jgi:hypothetical protein
MQSISIKQIFAFECRVLRYMSNAPAARCPGVLLSRATGLLHGQTQAAMLGDMSESKIIHLNT